MVRRGTIFIDVRRLRRPSIVAAALVTTFATAPAWAKAKIVPRPEGPGTTAVTTDPSVTVGMGLTLTPIKDPGDSLVWWPRRQEARERFQGVRQVFPEAQSGRVYQYLNALAAAFASMSPEPRPQFHFYVADTLNASIWPAGSGFFVLHAGLFSLARNPHELEFLLALELAHDVLEHNQTPLRAGDIKWEAGKWELDRLRPAPAQWWALLAAEDPIERGRFSYTLQQESDALELVYRFFDGLGWQYDGLRDKTFQFIQDLGQIPGLSSLKLLHANLGMALKLPHARVRREKITLDPIVSRETISRAMDEMALGGYQRYQWMRELAPYRAVLLAKAGEPENFREQTAEEVMDDGQLPKSQRLARAYLKALLEMRRRDWKSLIATSDRALALAPGTEPFLWFKLFAVTSLGQFNKCGDTRAPRWRLFDHKRSILVAQCAFLAGRYSTSAALLTDYRRRFPFDVEGAFWQALVDLRMRRKAEDNLGEMTRFWGERPYVRALWAIYHGLKRKPSEAKSDLDSIALLSETRAIDHFQPYSDAEWGAFAFANAWFTATYSPYKDRDESAGKLRAEALARWPLADFVRAHFPRQVWEER